MKLLFFIINFCLSIFCFSQRVGIEEWRDHLPYHSCIDIAKLGNTVYGATYFGLIKYSVDDNSVSKLSKVNYLSDIGISCIESSDADGILIVAYQNGNIDVIKGDGSLLNISDIKRKNIVGSKSINDIMFHNKLAYLSCDFGIVVIDILREEVKATYWTRYNNSILEVNSTAFYNSCLYATTSKGLFFCSINKNINDFNNWEKDNSLTFSDSVYKRATNYENKLFVNACFNYEDTVYYKDESGNWKVFSEFKRVYDMKGYSKGLVIANEWFTNVYDKNLIQTHHIYTYFNDATLAPNTGIIDKNDELWIADRVSGMIHNRKDWDISIIVPRGPSTDKVFNIKEDKFGRIFYCAGGINASWNNQYYRYGISYFDKEQWFLLKEPRDSVFDILDIAVSPKDNSIIYVSTWGSGLLEFKNGKINQYWNVLNSSLEQYSLANDSSVRTWGLCFDDNNNLWVSNSNSKSQLSVKTTENKWINYIISSSLIDQHTGKLAIDSYGRKWLQLGKDKGLVVFDDNNTLDNKADDKYLVLNNSVNSGNLAGSNVLDFVFDNDDELWIGTDKGICIIYSINDVFENNFKGAEKILIEQDGQAQYLLETEEITAIAVDAANRKWIGTSKAGVFLLSEDGTKQIYHFTEENSKLLSNNITSIAIHQKTGEVFIGTDKGLVGFMSTATEGNKTNDNILVFPNPVKNGYTGAVAIRGLMSNTNVKITDIEGNLVAEMTSYGGQAIWDQKNLRGHIVVSGIYLIFCTDKDGKEANVSKMAIIR